MKRLLLSAVLTLAVVFGMSAAEKMWNFSNFTAGTCPGSKAYDGLTIVGMSEADVADGKTEVTIDTNGKSIDGYSFTQRLKLGGAGGFSTDNRALPTCRYVSFQVEGDATITIYGMSSSSGSDRSVIVSDGTTVIEETTGSMPGASIAKVVVTYTGPAATIYVYSPASGINLYGINVVGAAPVDPTEPTDPVEPTDPTTPSSTREWRFGDDTVKYPAGMAYVTTDPTHENATGSQVYGEKEINGLTYVNNTSNVNFGEIRASANSPYTQRFQFNGGGSAGDGFMPTQRYLKFDVSGNATISISGTTGSNGSARNLFLTDGTKLIGTFAYPASADNKTTIYDKEVSYVGGATTLYLYGDAACNMYVLKIVETGTSIDNPSDFGKEVASVSYYDLQGRKSSLDSQSEVLIKVTTYTDGSIAKSKIFNSK